MVTSAIDDIFDAIAVWCVLLTSITLRKGLTILNFGVSSGLGWLGMFKYFLTASCLSTRLCATDTTLLAVQYKKTPYKDRRGWDKMESV